MSLLTCDCQNVKLYTASPVHHDLTKFTLPRNLAHLEEMDSFFQHVSIHRFGLGGIKIEQPRLASNRQAEGWCILRCDNCAMDIYAAEDAHLPKNKRGLGSGQMLVSMTLTCNEQEIRTCKEQPDYSAVFKMVLKDSVASDQLPKDVLEQPKWCLDLLTSMQQQLKQNLDDEAKATEDRIRRFSEKQRAALKTYQRKAEKDKNVLYNLICANLSRREVVPLNEHELDRTAGQAVKSAVSYEPYIPGSLTAPAVRGTQYMVHQKGQYAIPNSVNGVGLKGPKKSKKMSGEIKGVLEDAVSPKDSGSKNSGPQHRDSILPRSSNDSLQSSGSNHGNGSNHGSGVLLPGGERRSSRISPATHAHLHRGQVIDSNAHNHQHATHDTHRHSNTQQALGTRYSRANEMRSFDGTAGSGSSSTKRGSGDGIPIATPSASASTDTSVSTNTSTEANTNTDTKANTPPPTSRSTSKGTYRASSKGLRWKEANHSGDGEDSVNFLEGSPPQLVPNAEANTKSVKTSRDKTGRNKGSTGDRGANVQASEGVSRSPESSSKNRRSVEHNTVEKPHQPDNDPSRFELSHRNTANPISSTNTHSNNNNNNNNNNSGSRYVAIDGSDVHSEGEDKDGVLGSSLPIDIPVRATMRPAYEIPHVDDENGHDRQKPTDIARSMHALVAMNNQMYGHLPTRSRKYSVL